MTMPKIAVKTKVQVEQDNDFLTVAPEVSIFLACLGMVDELRHLERVFRASAMSDQTFFEQFNEILGQLTHVAEATARFDVLLPVMDYGKFSPFFWRWFNWWDDFLQTLTPRQIGQLERLARGRKPTINRRRPREDWLRYRQTPAFTLVVS
jgi:hypothetical protein